MIVLYDTEKVGDGRSTQKVGERAKIMLEMAGDRARKVGDGILRTLKKNTQGEQV